MRRVHELNQVTEIYQKRMRKALDKYLGKPNTKKTKRNIQRSMKQEHKKFGRLIFTASNAVGGTSEFLTVGFNQEKDGSIVMNLNGVR